MRLARKLMLLAIMALAALAMSATSASAQRGVTVTDEPYGDHCSYIVECEADAHSEEPTVIRAHLLSGPEVTVSVCDDEFRIAVETEDGDGYIYEQTMTGANCPNKPCGAYNQTSANGYPWPFYMNETRFGNPHEFEMEIAFCLEPAGGGTERTCYIEVGINETEMNHQYEFEAEGTDGDGLPCDVGSSPPPPGVRELEVDGHWTIEDENVEIEHAVQD